MKRKLTVLLTAMLLLTGIASWGQQCYIASIDLSEQGYDNAQDLDGVPIAVNQVVTLTFYKGTNNNNGPKYYNVGTAVRCYGGNYFTVTTSSGYISAITLTFGSGDGSNEITTDVGTFESPTWTGNNATVNFTISGTSGQRRIKALEINYCTDGGQQQTVATPTFSPVGGTYTEQQTVSISCATDGATIHYTTNGNEPTESSSVYYNPLDINETTTVKAKAWKNGYTASNTATATYTFPTMMTIAEARALAVGEHAQVQGVVTFIDGRNVYIQDLTASIDLYINNNTVPEALALGDMVKAYGTIAVYNGLVELSGINGGNQDEFQILSSNNPLPLATKTIEEILEGASADLQATRVLIEAATIGAINTNGNTPLTQGANSINIYRMPALSGIEEGDVVNVVGVVGYYNAAQMRVALASDVTIVETPQPNPELNVSVTVLNDFSYLEGEGPSPAMSFTVSGSNLEDDVTFMAPADFELSFNATQGYLDNNMLEPIEGTLAPTNVYIRLKAGLEVGNYSGNLIVASGDLMRTIVLSGTVQANGQVEQPILAANPISISGMTYDYEEGGPSEIYDFELSGNYLVGPAYVFPSESFEVSTLEADSFLPENPSIIFNQGSIYGIKINLRMKAGLEVGGYNEQIFAVSEGADTLFINVSGTVTGSGPTPPPMPTDGSYVRISDLSQLVDGSYVVFAARFDDNATDYYAMSNQSSGKPTGVLFTSATADENEVLPASIVDEESSYYWTVGVTANGYTFTNANGELIGYSSSTNFATGGDNTEWSIEVATAGDEAMVPEYTGFLVTNVNNDVRHFALNSNHNFGPYHTNNLNNSGYNFYLDLFVKTEGIEPPTPTVATPTFTPESGTYFEAQTVSISCATEDATIHYTVDGTDPTESSPVYSAPLTIIETTTVKAFAVKEGYNDSNIAEVTYTFQSGFVTIFNQDWEDEMNGWTFVDVEGEMSWTVAQYSGNHYAYANGYNHGTNEDWCISPAFNLDAIGNPVLSFRTAKNYNGPDLEVFFSNDYDGEDPTNATWQLLVCPLSSGNWAWVESGDINLGSFSGTECYIGFKYTSEEGSAAGWEVDDILLLGQTSAPVVTVSPLTLAGFTYTEGNGPSAEQSFTVSGLNLSGNITLSDAPDFEISLTSGNDFNAQSSITLTPANGIVEETTVYVRLKAGLAVGNYNGEVISIISEVDDFEVECSGTVTAQPVPGDDYVRISNVSQLVAGNRVILAARYNETANAYVAFQNTLTGGKLSTTEFASAMNGTDEIIPSEILTVEDDYYWTVGITAEGYTFTNANGDMIGYNSSTNFNMNGEKTNWTVTTGISDESAMMPNYFGFNIVNVSTNNRAFALNANHVCGAYHTQNMTSADYNFFLDIFMQGEGGTCTVAAPIFNPEEGTYYEAQEVTISCVTEGATIWYSPISQYGPWTPYTEAITVDEFASIWAYAEKEGCNDSPIVNATYIIQDNLVVIFNQDWEEDWNGWTEVLVEGDSLWRIASYQGNHYAYANGYNHPATEDWLISPAFDLDSYSDVVLTFRTAMNYSGPDIEVYFSNDYDGQDPTVATWQSIECELSTGGWNWVESGEIDLSGFSGSDCYIGFKYTCTGDEAAGWEVDDIMLVSGGVSTEPYLIATPNALSGFVHIIGEGPSEVQTFVLTGGNLPPVPGGTTGSVSLEVDNMSFELSLDGETFNYQVTIYDVVGTLEPTTVYVRLNGDQIGAYEGIITIEDYVTTSVSLAGEVLSADQPAIRDAFMPLYIQGNNGSNNNRVPVAIAVYLENLEPNTTYRYTNQFVDDNDGPETAGAGNVIYANPDGFYRSTNPSLSTEGGYGEFTADAFGEAMVWFVNEPTANARFTPGNHVYLRIRINDGHDGTTAAHTFTTEDYATVLNFGTEYGEYQGTAFYAKSNEAPMTFAMMYATIIDWRPVYSTPVETTGVDYGSINQYADFYKDEVAGKEGWFGGILPNDNEIGINMIVVFDMTHYWFQDYYVEDGQWKPEANTVNPNGGLNEPIFIDLTYDGVEEQQVETNVKVWSADHEFVIENGENERYQMTVFNVLGQPMMQRQINAGSTERISHSLANGLYVINLRNDKNTVSVKVIVR